MLTDLETTQETPAIPSHEMVCCEAMPRHPREGRSYRVECDTADTQPLFIGDVAMATTHECYRCRARIELPPNHRGPVQCQDCADDWSGDGMLLAHLLTLGVTLWFPALLRAMDRLVGDDPND